jgi:hypothetical protein
MPRRVHIKRRGQGHSRWGPGNPVMHYGNDLEKERAEEEQYRNTNIVGCLS